MSEKPLDNGLACIDLSPTAVKAYWASIDPAVSAFVKVMAGREGWTVAGGSELGKKIIDWARSISDGSLDAMEQDPGRLSEILAALPADRALYIYSTLQSLRPGLVNGEFYEAIDQIDISGPEAIASVVARDRLVAVFRYSALARAFSHERREMLAGALREGAGDA